VVEGTFSEKYRVIQIRSLIKRYFPNAKILADRFYVIRLLNQMCLHRSSMKHHRGLLATLRINEANLTIKRLNSGKIICYSQQSLLSINTNSASVTDEETSYN
jgi:hypothetical protein